MAKFKRKKKASSSPPTKTKVVRVMGKKKRRSRRRYFAGRKRGRSYKVHRVSNYAAAGVIGYQLFKTEDGVDAAGWLKQVANPDPGITRSEAMKKTAESLGARVRKDWPTMAAALIIPPVARRVLPQSVNPTIYKRGKHVLKLF